MTGYSRSPDCSSRFAGMYTEINFIVYTETIAPRRRNMSIFHISIFALQYVYVYCMGLIFLFGFYQRYEKQYWTVHKLRMDFTNLCKLYIMFRDVFSDWQNLFFEFP